MTGHAINLGDLPPTQRKQLEDVLERYQARCRQAPALTDLRAAAEELDPRLRPLALAELVGIHMEVSCLDGHRRSLEDYLARIPELRLEQAWLDRLRDWEKHLGGDPPEEGSVPPLTPQSPSFAGDILEEGGVVGGYRLIRLLGRSHAEVWLAENRGGIEVALKIIPLVKEMAGPERDSLELIKNLRHPFLIGIRDYWVDGLRLYIAMDKADGTLRERLEASPQGLTAEEVVPYLEQAAQALDFLHSKKIIHRDIKPANLLLLAGFVKVADFGTAFQMEGSITEQAGAAGTARYMAPEVFFHGLATRRSDQFSLAVTYAELRTGRSPFPVPSRGGLFAIGQALAHDEPDLEGLLPAEQSVLKKALAKDYHQRFDSCVEFVEALRTALAPPATEPGAVVPQPAQAPAPAAPAAPAARSVTPVAPVRTPEKPTPSAPSLQPRTPQRAAPLPAWRSQAKSQPVAPSKPSPAAPPKRSTGSTVPPGPRTEGSLPLPAKAAWQGAARPPRPAPSPAPEVDRPRAVILSKIARLVACVLCATVCLAAQDVSLALPKAPAPVPVPTPAPRVSKPWVPPHGRQVGRGSKIFGGKEYAEVFLIDLGQGVTVEFRWIEGEGVTPFYAMTTKVPNELFALYPAGRVAGVAAEDRQRPVTNVPFEETKKFAQWLGQRMEVTAVQLPTEMQWNRLAFRKKTAEPWTPPAFGLGVDRPLAMDRAGNQDVSDQGCVDAYSNGREWTRTEVGKVDGRPECVLKGKDFKAEAPFMPGESRDRTSKPQADLGFRVIVELPES
jgi:serine/threonine protein kinase